MYNSAAYKRSRIAYTGQCTFEYFATLLVTDAFLATLFATTLLASKLFEYIQNNGNKFAGLSIYPQQLFAIVTIVVLSISIVCIKRTLEGKEIKIQ